MATVGDAQHVDISASERGWLDGTTHYLALRVKSASGRDSDGYSHPATIDIAPKPTITIDGTPAGMESTWTQTDRFGGDGTSKEFRLSHTAATSPDITIDGVQASSFTWSGDTVTFDSAPGALSDIVAVYDVEGMALTSLPVTADIISSGEQISLAIERAESLPTERPDGTVSFGPEGETVALSESNVIAYGDLTGYLDDGGLYRLVASTTDEHGQTAQATLDFEVRWEHQAWTPSATVTVDGLVAKIATTRGEGYETGDVVDIYRLSSDEPELIISGGEFGETYVDPYPAFGEFGGHRVVCRTANGDYTTGDEIAETDYLADDGDCVRCRDVVIEYDDVTVHLPYNLSLGHKWAKDFKRTKYLGGSTEGDWNVGVERDLTVSAGAVKLRDADTILAMRGLAAHTGVCHVRTPDGCSFDADVQVDESVAYNSATVVFDLAIKRVDTRRAHGMTLDDWEAR